ncbi:MAG: hypothetical protein ACFB51_06540 [Anaerolineae bacterium]
MIAEKHPGMQLALSLIGEQVGFELVGVVASPDLLWDLVQSEQVDLLIITVELLGANPSCSLQSLRKISPALSIVVVTGNVPMEGYAQADLCIHQDDPPSLVINRLRKLTNGGEETLPGGLG